MAKKSTKITLTKKQVQLLVDTWELDSLMNDEEESMLLKDNNPELYDVYLYMYGFV